MAGSNEKSIVILQQQRPAAGVNDWRGRFGFYGIVHLFFLCSYHCHLDYVPWKQWEKKERLVAAQGAWATLQYLLLEVLELFLCGKIPRQVLRVKVLALSKHVLNKLSRVEHEVNKIVLRSGF